MDIKLNGFTERTVKLTAEDMLSPEFAARNANRDASEEANRDEFNKWDGGQPFAVSISDEGINAYADFMNRSAQTKSDNIDSGIELDVKAVCVEKSSILVFNRYLENTRNVNGYISTENKCKLALKAYAESYDELVRKYDNGLNEICYIRDVNTENGYREMTLQDELKWLDDSFAFTAEYIRNEEAFFKNHKDSKEEYYNEMERLIHAGKMRDPKGMIEEIEQFRKRLLEKEPTNLTECLMNAKKEFLNLYLNRQEKVLSIPDILNQIKIFP